MQLARTSDTQPREVRYKVISREVNNAVAAYPITCTEWLFSPCASQIKHWTFQSIVPGRFFYTPVNVLR